MCIQVIKREKKEVEESLENYKRQDLSSEDGRACQWLKNNISKINWTEMKYGNFISRSRDLKYKIETHHRSFSINNIQYNYIDVISENYILNLIEIEIRNKQNQIKRNQKLENL